MKTHRRAIAAASPQGINDRGYYGKRIPCGDAAIDPGSRPVRARACTRTFRLGIYRRIAADATDFPMMSPAYPLRRHSGDTAVITVKKTPIAARCSNYLGETPQRWARMAKRGPQASESDEQIDLARRLDAAGLVWFAVPNGGSRHVLEARNLRRQGVKEGVPDLIVLTPSAGAPRGVALEMKRAPPAGTLRDVRPEQWGWLARFEQVGFVAVVGLGCADAVRRLQQLGYEVRG